MKQTPSSCAEKEYKMPYWVKKKNYTHIGLPLPTGEELQHIISYVKNPEKVAHHAFSPLIRKDQISRRYSTEADGKRHRNNKHRPISYASHIDRLIYSYYAKRLNEKYEETLREEHLQDVVIAYRRIPTEKGDRNKCNIQFARDAFHDIKEMTEESETTVMVFDIKGFFDNLDHRLIKEAWKYVMGHQSLPADEYSVYHNVVHYHYINQKDLFKATKEGMLARAATKDGGEELVRKSVKMVRRMRRSRVVAYCEKSELRQLRRHVHAGYRDAQTGELLLHGIPQGLPISAVLANMYMLPFDKTVNSMMEKVGGFYRRYCDDLIVACPSEVAAEVKEVVMREISERRLTIEEHKTKTFRFKGKDGGVACEQLKDRRWTDSALVYLGFSFDGTRTLLKSAWVNNYYRKLYLNIKRKERWVNLAPGKRRHYRAIKKLRMLYTLEGACGFKQVKDAEGKWVKDLTRPRRNSLTYVLQSCGHKHSDPIFGQLRRSRRILEREIAKAKERISPPAHKKGESLGFEPKNKKDEDLPF